MEPVSLHAVFLRAYITLTPSTQDRHRDIRCFSCPGVFASDLRRHRALRFVDFAKEIGGCAS